MSRGQVCNMDGTQRRELHSADILHIFGLALLGPHLYWSDTQRRTLDRIDKNTGMYFTYGGLLLLLTAYDDLCPPQMTCNLGNVRMVVQYNNTLLQISYLVYMWD